MQLIYPMFAMVLLSFLILVRLFQKRVKSVKDGAIEPYYFKVYQGGTEPEDVLKLSRHFGNLFEAPVLFYVVCLAVMQIGVVGSLFLTLAWIYVLLRVMHAFIHTGTNRISSRIQVYFSSWIVLLLMWLTLIFKVAMMN